MTQRNKQMKLNEKEILVKEKYEAFRSAGVEKNSNQKREGTCFKLHLVTRQEENTER